jgi:hypothetical protein
LPTIHEQPFILPITVESVSLLGVASVEQMPSDWWKVNTTLWMICMFPVKLLGCGIMVKDHILQQIICMGIDATLHKLPIPQQ